MYNQLEDKKIYQKNNNLSLVTPFVNKRSNVDCSTLYSITKPFELLYADISLDEKILVLTERLKKKDALGNLYKASTENMLFFKRNRIFTIYKGAKLNNGTYLYCVEEDSKKINGRFLGLEQFPVNKFCK